MKPSRHIIVSFVIGTGFWLFTRSVYASILCFISGIIADIDHALEYIIHFGWKDFNFKNVYIVSEQTGRTGKGRTFKRLFLILHTGELSILLLAATIYTKNIYLLAITLGHISHLIMDSMANRLYPCSYFILWRFYQKFHTDRLMRIFTDDKDKSDGSATGGGTA